MFGTCRHPNTYTQVNYITGKLKQEYMNCETWRKSYTLLVQNSSYKHITLDCCSPKAAWFEPKKPDQPPDARWYVRLAEYLSPFSTVKLNPKGASSMKYQGIIQKSRTYDAAALVGILGVIETNFNVMRDLLGPWYGVSYIVIAILFYQMRRITTSPVGQKPDASAGPEY